MKLQTKIPLEQQRFNQIDYNSKVLLLGSCFSQNIGDKFQYFKFQSLQNPFGILFQPLAIERLIINAINQKQYTKEDIFLHNEQWHCFDAHSRLSHSSKDEVLKQLNENITQTYSFIKKATHICITLGTSWVYRFIETDLHVANCHKIPQKKFLKELLSVDEITSSLDAMVNLVKSVNPNVNFIFTVSPVRHIKDGFVENTRSKSHLITAVHDLISNQTNCNYFPSYEIVIDELRDYRFYNEDMLHLNNIAVNYIWEKFASVWVNTEAQKVMEQVLVVQRGLAHRPFNKSSESHQEFVRNLNLKIQELKKNYNHISF